MRVCEANAYTMHAQAAYAPVMNAHAVHVHVIFVRGLDRKMSTNILVPKSCKKHVIACLLLQLL